MNPYALARSLRGLAGARQALCRCKRVSPVVALVEAQHRVTGDTRLAVSGIMSCGSVWSCPLCARRIMAERAREIRSAVESHGRKFVHMLSLTVRHREGDDLGLLSGLVASAYSAMKAGRRGQSLRAALGWIGDVRAAEQTHGPNGWHPHLHALWFTGVARWNDEALRLLSLAWGDAVTRTFSRAVDACINANETQLAKLVGVRVVRRLGLDGVARALLRLEIAPDWEHGCRVSPVTDGAYLAKMGLSLETAWGMGKLAKRGHRSAWQIAADAGDGDQQSRALWTEHHHAMRGRRQLTWSRGIRERLNLGEEVPDAQLASELGPCLDEDRRGLARVDPTVWDTMSRVMGQDWFGAVVAAWESGRLARVVGIEMSSAPVSFYRCTPRPTVQRANMEAALARAKRRWVAYREALRKTHVIQGRHASLAERELILEECTHLLFSMGLFGSTGASSHTGAE